MGPGAVDTGTDPGPGGAPARGDAGAAAAAAPHSQARCSKGAGHPPPACDHGGSGCHRGCRSPPSLPCRPAPPGYQEFHQAARKLEELCTALSQTEPSAQDSGPRDAAILSSLPGVGPVTLATLLTEAAGPISRRDYIALRTLSGVAPVTKRSGKSCIVIMRNAAQVRLRNAVFHWARVAVLNDPKCRSRYAALRARGHSYGRALRGVAHRLLGVACVLLQRGMLFDPDHDPRAAP